MNRILRLLIIIAVLIIGISGISAILFYQMKQTEQWIAHTQEVLYMQSEVYSNLQDMNLASRGYAFTGETDLLEPYKNGKALLVANMNRLKQLTSDNSKEQVNIQALNHSVTRFNDMTAQLIETRSAKLVSLQKADMDGIRQSLAGLVAEEKRSLAERLKQSSFNYLLSWLGLAVQLVSGVALLWTCTRTIKTYTAENQKRVSELETEIIRRTQTENALKETTEKLVSSNGDLQQFAYVASHDLQEPLRAVIGFMTLLNKRLQDKLEEDEREWLMHAVDGAQRMRTLVHDLLSFSRVDSQGQALEDDVDTNKSVKAAITNLSAAIEESHATVEFSGLPKVTADSGQLTQLFQNLIGNAIKYRSKTEKPNIFIAAWKDANRWIFSVKDNGIGFDMEQSQRIFVIFQRLHTRGEHPGTGIGLALCKRIVERHGGEIWCESKIGDGSTFFFSLPIKRGK